MVEKPELDVLRHSTAHVMAQAVCDLWPGARYAIGPPIEDGFYYDFHLCEAEEREFNRYTWRAEHS